jgi:carbon storage regulator
MLVLTRMKQQSIVIGDDVHVKVIGITAGRVRLGITAPRSKRILREEIVLAIEGADDVDQDLEPVAQ